MNRPEFHPDNHEALYDYYQHKEPSKRLMKSVVLASSLVYKPRLHFAAGAESELAELKSRCERFVFASAHYRISDQFAEFAAMRQSETLAAEAEHTFVIGKPSYATSRLLGRSFDAAGWVPAFRKQDYPKSPLARAEAAKSLFSVCTSKIVEGWNMLLFPEGTRNKGDPKVTQRIQGGIGRIASAVSKEGVGIAIIPIVPWWGDGEDSSQRRPDIFIGNPIEGPFTAKADATAPLQAALEDGVHQVSEINFEHLADKRVWL
ncbi:MAG: 1-acyl-sn-glycerol-3-phosphate acyltransferase [bacterium]|nr:1-acyl-sn-glycerol-3-phosphate acyltransferase [bacterium]